MRCALAETIQTVSACRIERIIYRQGIYPLAEFEVHAPAIAWGYHWTACIAGFARNGAPFIRVGQIRPMPAECAAALATALHMAIDWIAIEQAGAAK